jgi:hypothetical protein
MDYPNRIKLGVLLSEAGEYSAVRSHLQKIDLLTKGGHQLRDNLPLFLEQRLDEEPPVYENRLRKFSYSNVFGGALAQLAAKFSNGAVHLANATPPEFWEAFRENNDGQGRTESQLLARLFGELIPYRRVFAHIDLPVANEEIRSAADEERLGIVPRIIIYNALQVMSWHEVEGVLKWIKTFHLSENRASAIAAPITQATWTFIDDEYVVRYRANVRVVKGKIVALLDDKGEDRELAGAESFIYMDGEAIAHGFGRLPVVKIELNDSLWAGNQAYPKAEEMLRLECHRSHYLTSTYPQRTYKPIQKPADSLDETYVDAEELPPPTGLQYVLPLETFAWNEPTGQILDKVAVAIAEAAKDIRSILAVGGAYIAEGVSEASGVSKAMDFETEDSRLIALGHVVTDGLQDIYQLVAIAKGIPTWADISVSGLDDFGRQRLSTLLDMLKVLLEVDLPRLEPILTPTIYLIVREKVMNLIVGNLTPEQKAQVADELLVPTPKAEPVVPVQVEAIAP